MGPAFAKSGVTTLIRLSASPCQAARLELPEPLSESSSQSFGKAKRDKDGLLPSKRNTICVLEFIKLMFRSAHTQPSNCSLSDTNLVAVAFQLSFGVAFQLHLPTVAVGQPLLSHSLFVTGVSPSAVGVTLSLGFLRFAHTQPPKASFFVLFGQGAFSYDPTHKPLV